MNKIKEFFDERADIWDEISIPVKEKIKYILDKTEITENIKILDIACGTGAIDDCLLERNPRSILAVDLSDKMIEKAKQKYSDERITFKVQDALEIVGEKFDFIIIYNAFPHFLKPKKLIKKIYDLLNEGGNFVICHGMGRKDLNSHHKRKANEISLGLAPAVEVSAMLEDFNFEIRYTEDVKEIYIISAVKL